MSVTFNRSALVKAAKTAITNHEKAQAAYAKAVSDYKIDHRAEWSPAKVGELRNWLSQQIKRNTAPTVADARKALGVSDVEHVFYSPPGDYNVQKTITAPTGLLSPGQLTETRSLLQVLEAATGDTVTANELKLLGLTRLAHVFQAAAGAVATS